MSKYLNAILNKADEEHVEYGRPKIISKEFEPTYPVSKKRTKNPHTRVVTEVREVTYLYDIKVYDDEGKPRKETKTTKGFEIVKEELLPANRKIDKLAFQPAIVGEVTRDLRKKDQQYDDFGWSK
jgi:hypothetical protein